MDDLIAWLALELFVSILLGAWIARKIDDARWARLFVKLHTRPPVNIAPPTTAELHTPDWIEERRS